MAAISENGSDELRLGSKAERAAVAELNCGSRAKYDEGDRRRGKEGTGVGTWTWDPLTDVVDLSGHSRRLMGLSEATLDLPGFLERLDPKDRTTLARDLRENAGPGLILDVGFRTLGGAGPSRRLRIIGKRLPRIANGFEVCGFLIDDECAKIVLSIKCRQAEQRLRDVQETLIHVSRFTALGEMAYALAHEISQPLTAVAHYLQGCKTLLTAAVPNDLAAVRDAVERAADQGLRASRIIATMRDFTARGKTERSAHDLAALIRDAFALALIGGRDAGVSVSFAFDPEIGTVILDKVQIQQVLLNLLRNALEAMRDAPVCHLAVSTRRVETGLVEVRVADTGSGIGQGIAERLFQPFATTKRDGMGVGLSISRTIVEAHGGHMWAVADPGGGSIFSFTIATVSSSGEQT